MHKDDLQKVLDLHRLWLNDDPGGERADLRWADLQGVDLQGANLRGADLRWADLHGADLRGAGLRGADLRWADLRWADLRGANLRGVDLRWVDLRWADLRGADLDFSAWPLNCGPLNVIIDERLARQLAYHVFAVASAWLHPTPEQIDFANGFHRIGDVPPLEGGSHVDPTSLGK